MPKKIQVSKEKDKKSIANGDAKENTVASPKKEQPKVNPISVKEEVVNSVAPTETTKVEIENIILEVPKTKNKVRKTTKKNPPITEPTIETALLTEDPIVFLDIAHKEPSIAPLPKKSVEQLKYEKEVEQFEGHIKNTCEYWESHTCYKSHYEKYDITNHCTKQGITVKFEQVDGDTTKVTFTKGRTSFSFKSKTIFW